MRYGRRFSLPIDPWPRASLGERLSVTVALCMLLLLPFIAVGAAALLTAALVFHVYRSFDVGAAVRAAIDRRALRLAGPGPAISRPGSRTGRA